MSLISFDRQLLGHAEMLGKDMEDDPRAKEKCFPCPFTSSRMLKGHPSEVPILKIRLLETGGM